MAAKKSAPPFVKGKKGKKSEPSKTEAQAKAAPPFPPGKKKKATKKATKK